MGSPFSPKILFRGIHSPRPRLPMRTPRWPQYDRRQHRPHRQQRPVEEEFRQVPPIPHPGQVESPRAIDGYPTNPLPACRIRPSHGSPARCCKNNECGGQCLSLYSLPQASSQRGINRVVQGNELLHASTNTLRFPAPCSLTMSALAKPRESLPTTACPWPALLTAESRAFLSTLEWGSREGK